MNIRLRALEPEDLDMLYRIENDQTLWDVGTTSVPYSRYILYNYIANASGDIYADHQVRLMVENDKGQCVGITDLTNFDPRNLRAELGIVVIAEHRRQGYASAILREITCYALHVLHLHQLYVVIDQHNEPSMELFRHSGWLNSATLADWLFDGSQYHDAVVYQKIL